MKGIIAVTLAGVALTGASCGGSSKNATRTITREVVTVAAPREAHESVTHLIETKGPEDCQNAREGGEEDRECGERYRRFCTATPNGSEKQQELVDEACKLVRLRRELGRP